MKFPREMAWGVVLATLGAPARVALAYPPHPPLVQAPGYCTSIYTNCSDGCGQYPDRVKEVKLRRVGNGLEMVAKVYTYVKWCDPSYCVPSHGTMRAYAWIDWNGDRVWQESERVCRFLDYRHLVGACKDTAIYVQTIPIPAGAVADTTWMRFQCWVSNDTDEWIEPCIQFGRCTYDNTGAANTLDKKVWLDPPAVTKITVGGNRTQIQGISDVVWQTAFDSSCEPGPNTGSGVFAAGFSDGGPQLSVELSSCAGDTSFVPRVVWRYELPLSGGRTFSRVDSLDGWRLTIPLDLPPRIGKETLRLHFDVYNEEGDLLRGNQEVPLTLYTTYARAIDAIDPLWVSGPQGSGTNTGTPRALWLDRATEWAPGDSLREDIARHLMDGIWNYGHGHWTYKDAPTTAEVPWLNHYWWLMSGVGGTRNYGDCFAVARMWSGLLSVLGVAGNTTAAHTKQFLSKADHVMSFDGVHHGNAGPWAGTDPAPRGIFDRWFFISHMVGAFLRDNGAVRFFDPTLDHEFANFPSDFVQSLVESGPYASGGYVRWRLEDNHEVALLDPKVKPWGDYSYQPYGQSPLDRVWPALARRWTPADAPAVQLQGPYDWQLEDANGDGRAEALRLDGSIRFTGDVTDTACAALAASLSSGAGPLGVSTAADRQSPAADVYCAADTGAVPFSIRFSGDDLFALGLDGTFAATVFLAGGAGALDSAVVTSPLLSHGAFGSDAARILGVTDVPIDSDGFGYINYIAADVTLASPTPASVNLAARLSLPTDTTALQTWRTSASIPAGETVVRVLLDATELVPYEQSGPYGLHVEIIGGRGTRARLDTLTAAYDVTDVDAPSASVNVNEGYGYIEDTDGSGLADVFHVTLQLDIFEGGEYVVDCELSSPRPEDPVILTKRFRIQSPEDIVNVPLTFDGRAIRASGVDGPYWIRRTRIFRSNGALASVHHDMRTNQFFSHTVFDSMRAPLVRVAGSCTPGTSETNGNGHFDALTFDLPVLADSTGDVSASGWLTAGDGTAIAFADTVVPALAGVPTLARLRFDGRTIFGRGRDGPYGLRDLLVYPTRNGRGTSDQGDRAAAPCATGALGFTAFEHAGVIYGQVRTSAGPLAGAAVIVDSLPPAEDFARTSAAGNYRAYRPTPGIGTAVVRLEPVAGVADTAWKVYVDGVLSASGRRIEVGMNDNSSRRVDFVVGAPFLGAPAQGSQPGRGLSLSPNPLRIGSRLRAAFYAPQAGDWTLRVYDLSGRAVGSRIVSVAAPGPAEGEWSTGGLRLKSGCYWFALEPPGPGPRRAASIRKIIVLR